MSTTQAITYPALGGCACERVRFELSEAPMMTWLCHCLTCRKFTGSMFAANSFVKAKTFSIVKGSEELLNYSDAQSLDEATSAKASASDDGPMIGHFCRTCHCLVYSGGGMMKDAELVIPSGTLDDPLGWRPSMEFWCRRRSPCLPSLGTPVEKMFDENPPE